MEENLKIYGKLSAWETSTVASHPVQSNLIANIVARFVPLNRAPRVLE